MVGRFLHHLRPAVGRSGGRRRHGQEDRLAPYLKDLDQRRGGFVRVGEALDGGVTHGQHGAVRRVQEIDQTPLGTGLTDDAADTVRLPGAAPRGRRRRVPATCHGAGAAGGRSTSFPRPRSLSRGGHDLLVRERRLFARRGCDLLAALQHTPA